MTDLERFQTFLDGANWNTERSQTGGITELPIGSREDIHYVTHDTMICFSYCDLYFREGTLVQTVRCGGRPDEHRRNDES